MPLPPSSAVIACAMRCDSASARRAHRLRLPRFAIVAVDLQVADRLAERRAAAVTHGEQRDLVVEVDEAFDDHAAAARAAALLRVLPRVLDVRLRAHDALSLARRAHHRLHDARHAELADGVAILGHRVREAIRRGLQSQLLGGQPPDAFAIHRQPRGARGRNHGEALRSPAPAASAWRSPRSPAR